MDRVRRIVEAPTEFDGAGVTVAVIDSGIDTAHPDLTEVLDHDASRSFLGFDRSIEDVNGHGTHVAGIIAGSGEASAGRYRGIAPGVSLVVLRVMGADGSGHGYHLAEALEHAMELEVDVINYSGSRSGFRSAGGPPPWTWAERLSTVEEQFIEAASRGILCVCAAGNAGPAEASIEPPALRREVLAVGATDWSGRVAQASSRGPVFLDPDLREGAVRDRGDQDRSVEWVKPDLVAPGGDVRALSFADPIQRLQALDGIIAPRAMRGAVRPHTPTDEGAFYGNQPGTSQATAVVSGLAAVALQYGRTRGLRWSSSPGTSLCHLFRHSCKPVPGDNERTAGAGLVTWTTLKDQIDACLDDDELRGFMLGGGQLRLV